MVILNFKMEFFRTILCLMSLRKLLIDENTAAKHDGFLNGKWSKRKAIPYEIFK